MAGKLFRIIGPHALAASNDQLLTPAAADYAVPAGQRAIVRHIGIVNTHAATALIAYVSIGTDAAGVRIIQQLIAAGARFDYYGPVTLEATEALWGHSSTTDLVITVDAELTVA